MALYGNSCFESFEQKINKILWRRLVLNPDFVSHYKERISLAADEVRISIAFLKVLHLREGHCIVCRVVFDARGTTTIVSISALVLRT